MREKNKIKYVFLKKGDVVAMKLRSKKLLCTFILLVLFSGLSAVKVIVLPEGGSITYFSLLFLWLVTYFFGFRYGLVVGAVIFAAARLGVNYLTGEHINWHPMAIILEYVLGCGVFCLGGILEKTEGFLKKLRDFLEKLGVEQNSGLARGDIAESIKLKLGYVIGIFGQFILYVISAVCFYTPDREGFLDNLIFCIIYDGSYLAIEGIFTLLLLFIPPVCEIIYNLKYVVTHEYEDETLLYF